MLAANTALPIIQALGATLERSLRANEGSARQQEILDKFEEKLPQQYINEWIAASVSKPLSGYAAGKVIPDTGSGLRTAGTLLGAYVGEQILNFLIIRGVFGGNQATEQLRLLADTVPAQTDEDPKTLKPVLEHMTSWVPGEAFLGAAQLASVKDEDLTPAEVYVKTRLIEIFDKGAPAAKLEKLTRTLSGMASGYHGYKRNGDSLGYGLLWAITGRLGLGLALAQGYSKPAP
tara:strand:- start:3142 stop:3840 length:699 start_codon:yes stop_codon:yes gene_type:complete